MLKATIAHTTAVSIRQAGNSSGKIIAWESVLNVSSAKCCLQKFLASIDARLQLPPRRLHTARIDVKLCEDVADDAGRPSMPLKVKKYDFPPSRNRTSDLRITISHSLPLFRELGVLDADFTLLYRQVYSPPLYQLSYRGQELTHFD